MHVAGRDIASVAALPVGELRAWCDGLRFEPFERAIADHVLAEARDRVRFLDDVGLVVPVARSRHSHALGRRGAAHQPRQCARLAARGHAVRARRADHRAARARRGPAAGAAAPPPAGRQHRADGRARPRRDPRGRLHAGTRARQRRTRRATSYSRVPRRAWRRVRSRASTRRARARFRCPGGAGRLAHAGSRCAAPRAHTLHGVDADIPLGALTVRHRRVGQRQEHARARRAVPRARRAR